MYLLALLIGSHGLEENLLHFCMRRKLDGMAELLLQPRLIEGKVQVLRQKSHDSKTPADIARKNGMKRICDQMEMMAVRCIIRIYMLIGTITSCSLFHHYRAKVNTKKVRLPIILQ